MGTKHLKATHAYHFISEAIIVYLVILPIMYHYYLQIPYWVYIVTIIGLTTLYTIYTIYTDGHLFYLLSIPFIIAIFYIVGFPIGLSITFTGLLTWRYIAIRSEMYLKREQMYIILTLVLTIIGLLYIRDLTILLVFTFQLLILIVGNVVSHILVTSKHEQKQLNRRTWPGLISFFALITGGIVSISDFLQYASAILWEMVQIPLLYFAIILSRLIPDLDYENLIDWKKFKVDEGFMDMVDEEELGPSILTHVLSYGLTYLIITLVILLVGIFLIIRQLRSRVKLREEEENYPLTNHVFIEKNKVVSRLKGFRKWRILKPLDPVRKLVFEFERIAAKHKKGRKRAETIEDWFQRIGISTNIIAYQKVRYGEQNITESEVKDLQGELKEMIDFISK